MKRGVLFVSLVLLTLGVFAKVPTALGQQGQQADDSAVVREAESSFHRAFLASDTKALDSMLTADFVWMHGDGAIWTKQRLIEELRSGKLSYKRDEIDNVRVTTYGPTAVIIGHDARQRGTGEPFDFNYTTTYVKQNGEWRVAVFHTSHCACAERQASQK